MFANRWNCRTLAAATACLSAGLVLGGCPANNNGGSAATTQKTSPKTDGSQPANPQVNLGPAVPTSPNSAINRNQPPKPTQPSNAGQYRSTSPLYEAIAAGDLARVEAALKAGENPNEYIQDGQFGAYTALHTAARLGHADILRLLIKHGGDVNAKAKATHQATPLHWAARANRLAAVEVLLEHGADVNAIASPNEYPQTPLKIAMDRNFWDVMVYLKAHGGKE